VNDLQQLTEEYQRIKNKAIGFRAEGRKWRKAEFEQRAIRNWQYFIGDQWHGKRMAPWKAKCVINHCSKVVRHHLPLLTDARPTMAIYGREPSDAGRAKMADQVFQFKWDQLGMNVRRSLAYFYALVFGIGWFHPYIDPVLRDGMGDLGTDVPDSWYCMPDPNATWQVSPADAMDNAEFFVYERPVPLRKIQRLLKQLAAKPEVAQMAGLVDGAVEHIDGLTGGGAQPVSKAPWARTALLTEAGVAIETVPLSGTTGSQQMFVPTRGGAKGGHKGADLITYSEVYMKDADYPEGLLVRLVDDYAIQIGPNPTPDGKFPFIPIICNPLPGRLLGYGVIDDIIPLQNELNKRRSQIQDILNIYKGPPIIGDKGVLDDPENMVFGPGVFLEKTPGKDLQIWQMPALPPDLWNSASAAETDIEKISGIGEMMAGRELKAGTPGVAVQDVMEAQLQRIRMIERWNNGSFVELGRQQFALLQKLILDTGIEYMIRVVGESGMKEPYQVQPDDLRGDHDFEFIPNSAYTLRRAVWFKQLADLRAMGAPVPWDALVDTTDLPDKEGIKKKIAEEEQRLAQEQAMMAQQQGMGGGPPPGGAPPMGG